jgi:membrane-bound metal-dependent hydrolase YbcI (DUF457 family)
VYLLGHIGFFLFGNYLYEKYRGILGNRHKLLLSIGAMIPDFIDKPIGALLLSTGRWLGHSIFFLSCAAVVALFIARWKRPKKQSIITSILLLYLGSLVHLLLDLPGLSKTVAFYPFLGSIPSQTREGFLLGFHSMYIILTEILGFGLIVVIGIDEAWGKKTWQILFLLVVTYLFSFIIMYSIFVGYS